MVYVPLEYICLYVSAPPLLSLSHTFLSLEAVLFSLHYMDPGNHSFLSCYSLICLSLSTLWADQEESYYSSTNTLELANSYLKSTWPLTRLLPPTSRTDRISSVPATVAPHSSSVLLNSLLPQGLCTCQMIVPQIASRFPCHFHHVCVQCYCIRDTFLIVPHKHTLIFLSSSVSGTLIDTYHIAYFLAHF